MCIWNNIQGFILMISSIGFNCDSFSDISQYFHKKEYFSKYITIFDKSFHFRRRNKNQSNCPTVFIINPTLNPFVHNAPFLYPLKTSENLKVFWCFQGVEKGCNELRNVWMFSKESVAKIIFCQETRLTRLTLKSQEPLLKMASSKVIS